MAPRPTTAPRRTLAPRTPTTPTTLTNSRKFLKLLNDQICTGLGPAKAKLFQHALADILCPLSPASALASKDTIDQLFADKTTRAHMYNTLARGLNGGNSAILPIVRLPGVLSPDKQLSFDNMWETCVSLGVRKNILPDALQSVRYGARAMEMANKVSRRQRLALLETAGRTVREGLTEVAKKYKAEREMRELDKAMGKVDVDDKEGEVDVGKDVDELLTKFSGVGMGEPEDDDKEDEE